MVIKHKRRTVQTIKYRVKTKTEDILDAVAEGCRSATRCMERVANVRALHETFEVLPHESKVRIDAGKILFCMNGYRYKAHTPKIASSSLIKFDEILQKARRKRLGLSERERLVVAAIKPHEYDVVAARTSKIIPYSRAAKDRINQRRRAARAAGHKAPRYTLRKRVVGFR